MLIRLDWWAFGDVLHSANSPGIRARSKGSAFPACKDRASHACQKVSIVLGTLIIARREAIPRIVPDAVFVSPRSWGTRRSTPAAPAASLEGFDHESILPAGGTDGDKLWAGPSHNGRMGRMLRFAAQQLLRAADLLRPRGR